MVNDVNGSAPNSTLTSVFPRQRQGAINSASGVNVVGGGIQVLKTWTHIVRPYDNFSVQNQAHESAGSDGGPAFQGNGEYVAGSIGGEKIIVRKKFFKFNTKLLMGGTSTGNAPSPDYAFTPQYLLMYYVDFEDVNTYSNTPASSSNPLICMSLRINYMDC